MIQLAAVSILVITLTLALWRPVLFHWRVTHVYAALLGATLIVLLDIVPLPLVKKQLYDLRFPFITIVSLMIITSITDRTGLFSAVARRIASAAAGNPRLLFTYLFFTGAVIGTFFTNDAAVLIFTPLVVGLIADIQQPDWTTENKLPFYFAVLYVANVVAVLIISNPINIIVCQMFEVSFLEYAKWCVVPGMASIVVSFFGLKLAFRKKFPASFRDMPAPNVSRSQRWQMLICGAVLTVALIGLFFQQFLGISTWVITLSAASVLMVFHCIVFRSDPVVVVKSVGWDVLIFVAGMVIIATGIRNLGFTEELAQLINTLGDGSFDKTVYTTGFVACVVSAIMNNHPTAVTMGLVIKDMDLPQLETQLTAFAALMGGDLGPKMLPTGSLAAMLWFRILRSRGVEVSYLTYVKLGVPITVAALTCSLLTLCVQYMFFNMFN